MKALIYDLVMLLTTNRTTLGIPDSVRMDRLMEDRDCISIAMRGMPKVLKEYINGSKQLTATFDVLAETLEGASDAKNLGAVEWLLSIGAMFEGMKRFSLSDNRTVLRASQTTMPTIVGRNDAGRVSYVMTVSIDYEEHSNGTTDEY